MPDTDSIDRNTTPETFETDIDATETTLNTNESNMKPEPITNSVDNNGGIPRRSTRETRAPDRYEPSWMAKQTGYSVYAYLFVCITCHVHA